MKKEQAQVGQKVTFTDLPDNGSRYEITIIGWDPYENKWVAASPHWTTMGISHIEDDDWENMEVKK